MSPASFTSPPVFLPSARLRQRLLPSALVPQFQDDLLGCGVALLELGSFFSIWAW